MKKYLLELLSTRLIVGLLTVVQLTTFFGFSDDQNEYTVKALFIYNFTKYVEWPEQNISPQFKIGVLGESPIVEKLTLILKGKKIYNRTIEVNEIKNIDEAADCQIIFISKNASDKLKPYLDRFSQNEILIVTEDRNMAEKGAGINIIEKDQRMKFEMNDTAIKKAGLKVANQLYELAIVIR